MAAEHVVEAIDDAGALQRPQIADLLDHDDQRAIAARILAEAARRHGIEVAAAGALDDLLDRGGERLGKRHEQIVAPLDQRQRRLARRARPEARQARQAAARRARFQVLRLCVSCPLTLSKLCDGP